MIYLLILPVCWYAYAIFIWTAADDITPEPVPFWVAMWRATWYPFINLGVLFSTLFVCVAHGPAVAQEYWEDRV
jgi:hypothetical protein